VPRLRSLLRATVAGDAAIEAYEMDLIRPGQPGRMLILNAHKLDYLGSEDVRIALAILDVTELRSAEKLKDDVVREKQVLLQELQHRVANSLQIIASVLMQSARKVQSDEARMHLHDAHHRVMSIATLQRQLAAARSEDVALRPYFADLCDSIAASMIYNHDLLTLDAVVDDSITTSGVSVSLGLIVTELVINAIKYAFPTERDDARILVSYETTREVWRLKVADNGIGNERVRADSAGLGTAIVAALAQQLEGQISTVSTGEGLTVSLAGVQGDADLPLAA